MSTDLLSKEQIETGYQRFLSQDQQAMAQVDAITQGVADALGTSLSELRRIETGNVLRKRAAVLGVDSFEFLLRFAVQTETERQKIRLAQKDEISRAIGLK